MKRLTLLFLLLSVALIVAACGGGGGSSEPAPATPSNEAGGEQSSEAPAPAEQPSGQTLELVLGTGSTGGTYYPLGGEMANVFNNNIDGVNVTATASGASIENLAKIGSGEFDLGMTVHLPAQDAFNGEGEFEGRPVENFAFIGHIYPEVLQIVVRESSGIESVADLRGKKVAIGPTGSASAVASQIILDAYGIGDDYTAYSEGFGDAKDKVQDGTIDASIGILGLPASSIQELQAATGDAKILEISGPELAEITSKSGYGELVIPAGTYEWINEDVTTISAYAVLVANTDTIDDDLAYQLAKVMVENSNENTHAQAVYMTKENALNGADGLPIHPGAERYYKEIGLLP